MATGVVRCVRGRVLCALCAPSLPLYNTAVYAVHTSISGCSHLAIAHLLGGIADTEMAAAMAISRFLKKGVLGCVSRAFFSRMRRAL